MFVEGLQMSYRLLVVDIDGTLLGKDGTISAEDREALVKARNLGIKVSLSTGRVPQACSRILNQLPLDDYHVFFDGGLVSNPGNGEEIFVSPLSKGSVRQIVEYAHQTEMECDLYSANHYFIERETWVSDIRRQFFSIQPVIVDFNEIWQKERIIKGTVDVKSDDEKAKADSFYKEFKGRLDFSLTKTPAYPDVDFINVVAPYVSKGKALEALASFLKVPLTEVIAIGDGANDISLLSTAGLAVAMDNASNEVKAVADHVTLDIDHSGVAMAVNKLLL
jgi:Cof subfamily protein (haloacid dehalogenase superfamily)